MREQTWAVFFILMIATVVVAVALPGCKNAGGRSIASNHLHTRVSIKSRCLCEVAAVAGWTVDFVGGVHTIVFSIATIQLTNAASVFATLHVTNKHTTS